MTAVYFVVTIPTETEETRLKGPAIFSKPEGQIENQQEPKTNLLNQEPLAKSELSFTPVSSANVPRFGTFPKRAKAKSQKNLQMSENSSTTQERRKSWDGLRPLGTAAAKTTKSNAKKKQIDLELKISNDDSMEVVLREVLKKYQIKNAVWIKDIEKRLYQVVFTIEFNETYENILDTFHIWGIGDREGSTVSVMNCIVSKTYPDKDDMELSNEYDRSNAQKQGAWDRFMNSVRSRLNVAQVVHNVRQDAAITFDFIVSVISAAILASFGLAEDNTILLVSSMLISPLMGPIIAGIFGTVIKDQPLRTLGLRNELIGIFLATTVGFLFGLLVACIDERYNAGVGPTAEMLSRCELYSLLEGVFIAIPSGAAAAISILGGNVGSLVGVAISASLLPPAVNTGLFWALACVYKVFENDNSRFTHMVKTARYSKDQSVELAVLGSISLCLTISNIICIYIMGILVLKVKEIAPIFGRNNREFWKHDIKIARDINKNGYDTDDIINELANMPQEDQKVLGLTGDMLRNMQLEDTIYRTWSPMPVRPSHQNILQLENVYSTVVKSQDLKPRFSINCYPPTRFKDYENPYTVLHERMSRRATLPTKPTQPLLKHIALSEASHSNHTTASNTPTSMKGEHKQRKFIVTPAEEPLRLQEDVEEEDYDVYN